MRHTIAENINVLGKFNTGDTVTLSLYLISDESVVTLTSNSCNEIASTGVFKWNSSNIATAPTVFSEYLWIMTNSTSSQYGKIVLGGYPDSIKAKTDNLPASPAPASEYNTELTAIQADLNNPSQYKADISNLDVAVSTRATQADILSDATPFSGALISKLLTVAKFLGLK